MNRDQLLDQLAARICAIDGFHRPGAERYRRGNASPEGHYYDSFDYPALRAVLLEPLAHNRAYRRAIDVVIENNDLANPTLVVKGVRC